MMDWEECNRKKMVKPVSRDDELIGSLKISADKSFQSASRLELDEITATSIISLYYNCMRELLEVLGLLNGFKIYNHDCYCAFLKEVLSNSILGESFDRFRKIRNGIHYYGKDIKPDEAKVLIGEMKETIAKIKPLLK